MSSVHISKKPPTTWVIEKNRYSLLTINYVHDRHTEKLKITLYEKDHIVQ